jgi:hypothetical protein
MKPTGIPGIKEGLSERINDLATYCRNKNMNGGIN